MNAQPPPLDEYKLCISCADVCQAFPSLSSIVLYHVRNASNVPPLCCPEYADLSAGLAHF